MTHNITMLIRNRPRSLFVVASYFYIFVLFSQQVFGAVITHNKNDVNKSVILGISFPPVQDKKDRNFISQELKKLNVSHIRIAENWKRRGPKAPMSSFKPLQDRLLDLKAQGLKVMLTVQTDAPSQMCEATNKHGCVIKNIPKFKNYLHTLLLAIGDDIEAIQFGNEWDNQFPGTPEQYLILHNVFSEIVRTEKPNLKIVLGGITNRAPYHYAICIRGNHVLLPTIDDLSEVIEEFCVKEYDKNETAINAVFYMIDNADFDVFDMHLYDAPDLWELSVNWLHRHLNGKPIWLTEFGGPHPDIEPNSPLYQAKRLEVYMEVVSTLPIQRAYYFKLLDDNTSYHSHSGLFTKTRKAKPSYEIFIKNRSLFSKEK